MDTTSEPVELTQDKSNEHIEQLKRLTYRLRPGDIVRYEANGNGREGPVTVRVTALERWDDQYCVLAEGKQNADYLLLPEERPSGTQPAPEALYCQSALEGPFDELDLHTHGRITTLRLVVDENVTDEFSD
ncbi:hypothetical protein JMJ58_00260 [Haloterrigena salifodinae]|uniref:Uncharacterized protein n=1 Tax=Haloterrigena salifodinae TaxID=2675099 RepID=A0A8T8E0N8_9EURY|nr:hypothetical protein [Haloterrigena salifodinae]QRV15375.1 hypothetical protein JMJ58_00260 [Haloterrigena salifodinae]